MIKLTIQSLVLFLTTFPVLGESVPERIIYTDGQIRDFIVGSWVISKNDTRYKSHGSVSTYNKDGTMEYKSFKTHECKEIHHVREATWKIQSGFLIITAPISNTPDASISYKVLKDEVIQISDESKVLKYKNRKLLYRTKSETCL